MRIRTIKPEWALDHTMVMKSLAARTLSVILITQADDNGNGEWTPNVMGPRFFPNEAKPIALIEQAMAELHPWYATVYQLDDKTYYHLAHWDRHQVISHRGKGKCPIFSEDLAIPPEYSGTLQKAPSGSRIKDQGSRIKEGSTILVISRSSNSLETTVLDVFEHWKSVMSKNGKTVLTPKRKRAILARLKEGYSVEDIKAAIDGCSQDAFSMGANDRSKPFNDIELICRSGEKLEGFRDAPDARTGPIKPWAPPHGMERWAEKVLVKELFPDAAPFDSISWDPTKKGWYHYIDQPNPGRFEKLELAHEEICARFDRYLAALNETKGSVCQQN